MGIPVNYNDGHTAVGSDLVEHTFNRIFGARSTHFSCTPTLFDEAFGPALNADGIKHTCLILSMKGLFQEKVRRDIASPWTRIQLYFSVACDVGKNAVIWYSHVLPQTRETVNHWIYLVFFAWHSACLTQLIGRKPTKNQTTKGKKL
jgi:hypothetical protein